MSKPLYFLFDYDGVLTHKVDFAGEVARKYRADEANIKNFFRQNLPACLKGEGDLQKLLEKDLGKIAWAGTSVALFEALYLETLNYHHELIHFIQTQLSPKHYCYVATNQDAHRFRIIQEDPLIQSIFLDVFCSCIFGCSKPDPEYFEKILSFLSNLDGAITKNQVIFIDDLKENVASARRFGIVAHHFENLEKFKVFMNHGANNYH